ncbi:MAG: hypothetical protein KAU52_09640 [Methanosarcinales archaeon]|nr:hypothetical protein [Methanosarcinales archaeon]
MAFWHNGSPRAIHRCHCQQGRALPIHVVADREFASPKLAEWLKSTCGVGATLRMKASMYLKGMDDEMPEVKIATLLAEMAKSSTPGFFTIRL